MTWGFLTTCTADCSRRIFNQACFALIGRQYSTQVTQPIWITEQTDVGSN